MTAVLDTLFPGDSDMARIMRAHDWAATPLGPPDLWPESLRIPLRMLLTSRFEMWIGWGEPLHFFYNDAYAPTLGAKHPQALGKPVAEVWVEIYDAVKDRFASVMQDGISTWDEALQLFLQRNDYAEETYHTFSYSPLHSPSGKVEGLICVVSEETERIISERRLKMLNALAMALLPERSRQSILDAASRALCADMRDFPFGMIHLFDGEQRIISAAGRAADAVAAHAWPFDQVRHDGPPLHIRLDGLGDRVPLGAWDQPAHEALIVPIVKAGQDSAAGALLLAINPYRRIDAATIEFAQLIASQIAGAVATADSVRAQAAEMERLRDLFAQSPSFTAVLTGPEHRFTFINPSYLKLIGHRNVIGQDIRTALPELAGQGLYELLDTVFHTGEPFIGRSLPITIQTSPGGALELRVLDFVYQPMRDAEGALSGIFVEGIDVTTAHDTVAALRESEGRFRMLAEAIANHVWTTGPDGFIDWINPHVTNYGGLKEADLLGGHLTPMIHPEDISAATALWAASIDSGATYETEFRLRRADGSYRWHVARAVPLRSDSGQIMRWIGTNTDIDDQKATSEALADLNMTLESQVAERTAELMAAEEALRQSQKMEAVGQLTGGIAHDFNNLLAGIMGNLELLEMRVTQGRLDAIPRHVQSAQGAAKRAAALTQRLLAFSRRQTLDPRPVNVNRLVGGMEEMIRRTIGPAIALEVVGAGGVWPTMIDAYQLENALLNLCINARDAMPGGGRLTIETANKWLDDHAARERDLPPGQYISLCVSDTGTGMTPDIAARAFDPFFTTKPLGEGTGLGLSMIYGFCRQSGGQVRLDTEEGQGTTMCLYLPRYQGDAEDADPSEGIAAPMQGSHGETVLVVDDEETVRSLVVDVLRDAGYHVLEAVDGPSGLRILESDARIDLLVTDVGLPGGMNGRQVADAGRQLRPGLRILFITGYAENAVLGNGHLDPGMQVVTKPFAIEILSNKIRDMIDG